MECQVTDHDSISVRGAVYIALSDSSLRTESSILVGIKRGSLPSI